MGLGFVRYFRLLYCCLMLVVVVCWFGWIVWLVLFGLFVLLVKLFVVMFVVYLFSLFVGGVVRLLVGLGWIGFAGRLWLLIWVEWIWLRLGVLLFYVFGWVVSVWFMLRYCGCLFVFVWIAFVWGVGVGVWRFVVLMEVY